jgi:hypothetical protein
MRPKRGAGVTVAARRKKVCALMARSDSSGQGQAVLRIESTAATRSGRRERPEDAILERTDILKEGSERAIRKNEVEQPGLIAPTDDQFLLGCERSGPSVADRA